jgi:hypothetical protein
MVAPEIELWQYHCNVQQSWKQITQT